MPSSTEESIGPGVRYNLGANDLFVFTDVSLTHAQGFTGRALAVNGLNARVIIERFATVSSDGAATIETTAISDNFHLRMIGDVRHSHTTGAAIELGGDNNTIEIAKQTTGPISAVGQIHSQNIGIWTHGDNVGSTTKIINDGYIAATWIAIQNDGTEKIAITNRGSISGSYAAGNGAYVDFGGATDTFINQGSISGRVLLGRGHDFFDGRTGRTVFALEGGDDNDTLFGSAFDDIMQGDHGQDLLNGFAGNDQLHGGTFNDTLIGGLGNDRLFGDENNDRLTGGAGTDSLTGGAGRDIFDFNARSESLVGAKRDVIQDFTRGSNVIGDDIDLSTMDARTDVGGNQAFTWRGVGAFTKVSGQLRYNDLGDRCIVQGDMNGDGKADFEIMVRVAALGPGDFIL